MKTLVKAAIEAMIANGTWQALITLMLVAALGTEAMWLERQQRELDELKRKSSGG